MRYTNPTVEEIENAITQRSQYFQDILVPYDALVCERVIDSSNNEESVRFRYDSKIATFNNHSLRQLLTKIQLSTNYWSRLYNWSAYQLMIDNFNFCNESTANEIAQQPRANDPSFLFRLSPSSEITLEEETLESEMTEVHTPIRAVLSPTYSIFDDNELFPMLIQQLSSQENITYRLYEYDDQITRLHVEFTDTATTYEEVSYSAGMIITNSEVGLSSIWIEPVIYRSDLLYMNRGSLRKQDVQLKIVHRGEIDRDRVADAFSVCSEISQVGIIQLIEAYQAKIEPKHALTFMLNIPELPNRVAMILNECRTCFSNLASSINLTSFSKNKNRTSCWKNNWSFR